MRCLIAVDPLHASLGRRALKLIGALEPRWTCTEAAPDAIATGNAEFVIPIVDAINYPRMKDDIAELHHARPQTRVLVVPAELPQRNLAELLSCGAFDFVAEPFTDDEFRLRLSRAAGLLPAAPARRALSSTLPELVGDGRAFNKVVSALPLIARCDADVLILGETGTGKELCARAVHYLSARSSRPWVAVNCGAIPTDLIESELFGHVRGAFTHAHTDRSGLIREAEGGSLFLDEIDSMPLGAQCKLLRFVQDKQYREVGSSTMRQADVRVIAASNQNLRWMAAAGHFRQDLFFRLSVLELTLPPLRERREDIPALVSHFLDYFGRRNRGPKPDCSPAAMQRLVDYAWPGNVRELRHVLERAVLMSGGTVLQANDLDLPASPTADAIALDADSFRKAKARVVESFERGYLERLLTQFNGNVTHAALAAKKDRRAFFELMRKHGIQSEEFRGGYESRV
jgi:DNA-binding NtrC family response regulator